MIITAGCSPSGRKQDRRLIYDGRLGITERSSDRAGAVGPVFPADVPGLYPNRTFTRKKMFMHSDGNTLRIIPKLIDLGLDAMNCQIFCIGIEKLAPFKGKLTFWGRN